MKTRVAILFIAGAMIATAAAQNNAPPTNGAASTNATSQPSGAQAGAGLPAAPAETERSGEDKGQAGEHNAAKPSANDEASQATAPGNAMPLAGGSTLEAVLTKSLDARKSKEGQKITAKTTAAVVKAGAVTLPKDTKLMGHVTEAKARAKGDPESSLGIVFDKAVLKSGEEVPLHAVVQALAAPRRLAAADVDAAGSSPMPGGVPQSGGTMGGPPGAGGTASSGGNPMGAPGSAGGVPIGAPAGTAGSAPGTATEIGATLSSGAQGVVGIPGYTLKPAANPSDSSVIASGGKDVKLDGGTQMILRVITQ